MKRIFGWRASCATAKVAQATARTLSYDNFMIANGLEQTGRKTNLATPMHFQEGQQTPKTGFKYVYPAGVREHGSDRGKLMDVPCGLAH